MTLLSGRSARILLLLCAALAADVAWAQTPVVTWHYDNSRSGADTTETQLTPANVNLNSFGKLFTQPVDGYIVGHPLYLPGVSIPANGVHNVVYVATMNDTVYGFDANSGTIPALWTSSLLSYSPAGATPVPVAVKGCSGTVGWTQTGVIPTPVIDPVANIIYLLAETYESAKVVHRLHALDVTTGIEKTGWPVTIAANYTYNGVQYPFVDTHEMSRAGLLLNNGYVYVGFGSDGCNGGDQGWMMSINTTTGELDALDLEPGNQFGSVWQKGAGLSADSEGYVYADTGEGGMVSGVDLAITVFKVAENGTSLSLADWFTPWNWSTLSNNDEDINNSVLILPDQTGAVPHEAITLGKEGTIYVLNRDSMGHLCSTCSGKDTQIVQELPLVAPMSYSPVLWNNSVYVSGSPNLQIYSLSGGLLTAGISKVIGSMTHPVVTADGTNNGIIWIINGNHVSAFNALTLALLYTSNQAAGGRDTLPAYAHFASPIVADGQVLIGTQNSLVVYGLFLALDVVSGNQQSGAVQTLLPLPLEAQPVDPATGKGISGITVTFSDGGKGGIFGNPTGVTDVNGMVSTTYTLPYAAGTYAITANSTGYGPAIFTETAVTGAATALAIFSGNRQTTTVGRALPKNLVVKAHDAHSNGVPGVAITFSDGGAGGTFGGNPIITNSLGQATVTYTAGITPGTVRIIASATGLHVVSFTEAVDADAAHVTTPISAAASSGAAVSGR